MQLHEVRDGTDFEAECWKVADEGKAALAFAESVGVACSITK
jgi:hypothetical protein